MSLSNTQRRSESLGLRQPIDTVSQLVLPVGVFLTLYGGISIVVDAVKSDRESIRLGNVRPFLRRRNRGLKERIWLDFFTVRSAANI